MLKQTHLGSLAAGVASDDSPSESWDSEPEADLTCVAMRGGTSSSRLRPPPGIGTCSTTRAVSGNPGAGFGLSTLTETVSACTYTSKYISWHLHLCRDLQLAFGPMPSLASDRACCRRQC